MPASITYAGVELPLSDPAGVVQKWQDSYQDFGDSILFGPRIGAGSLRLAPRGSTANGVGVSPANETAAPRLKINALLWPSGYARWGRFIGLVDSSGASQIDSATSKGQSAELLVLSDGNGGTMTTRMYALPPRPISAAGSGREALYLLPLVCPRYPAQMEDTEDLEIKDGSTWDDIDAKLDDTTGYEQPDAIELTRRYESKAEVCDAAALSTGGRFLRLPVDPTAYSVQRFEDARAIVDANFSRFDSSRVAGGTRPVIVPAAVRTTHRRYKHGSVDATGKKHIIDTDCPNPTDPQFLGYKHTIHSTAFADFGTGAATPDNSTALDALSDKIATDFYFSLARRYDVTYGGIVNWTHNAFDDWIEWACFSQGGDGEYRIHTRIQSLADNFAWSEQQSQFAAMPVFSLPNL